MSRLALLLKLVLGGILLYAGALKLADTPAFATDIANYHVLAAIAPWLAVCLPTIEIAVGIALVILPIASAWCQGAALVALSLFVVFTGAIAQALVRNINVSCGCFGSGGGQASWLTVGRDVAFVLATSLFLWLARKKSPLR